MLTAVILNFNQNTKKQYFSLFPAVGDSKYTLDVVPVEANSTEAHCLRLPGKKLDVSALLHAKYIN